MDSIIRHNTVPYRRGACAYSLDCGGIDIDCKSDAGCPGADGYGTLVYDNVADVTVRGGARVTRNDHNDNGPGVRYVGGASPPSNRFPAFSDYLLAPGSAGAGDGDHGTNLGITGAP